MWLILLIDPMVDNLTKIISILVSQLCNFIGKSGTMI